MRRRIEDWLLALLQRRCDHPDRMVACDILEGSGYRLGLEVSYCRRCGAVKPVHTDIASILPPHEVAARFRWRLPDPNLWRG